MFRKSGFIVAILILTIVSLASVLCQAAQPQALMTRHVPQVVANGKAQRVGQLPANQTMRFDIVIPLRDQTGLDIFYQELYDPTTPFYHQFITPEEFTARFGPTEQDWEAMVNFAKASGFQIFSGSRDERDLRVTGTVANIEKAFNVTLGVYQDPNENRTFFSPDREPSVDLPFPLWHVSGLDSYVKKYPMHINKYDYAKKHGMNPDEVVKPDATTGSCPSASFCASDMRAAYYGGTALTGTGQTVGLFEYEGTNLSDLALYYKNAGQTEPFVPTVISVDGTSTTSSDDIEQTLDMGQAMGMAPGLTMVYNYVGSTDTAILSAMVANVVAPISKQIGCSWGWTADVSTLAPYFTQMGTQDQNFFAASGDSGYWHGTGNSAPWPADDALVVGVGGTDLTTSSAAGPWASEGGWTDSGGGITTNSVPIPSWQQLTGVINSSNAGSTTLRNGPDVSANANFTFYVCGGGSCTANEEGGTSFAAPMWAGYLALANQQAAANGEVIGFINPIIYPANLTSSYSTYFHDISDGASNGKYKTVTGYDLLSGWGSPNGSGLINLLAPVAGGTTPQTITFTTNAPSSAAYNSQFTVAATASSGLAVTFTSSGSCSNSGATYTMTAGSGTCSVIANQSGNTTYAVAPTVTQTTSATLASQTITFTTNAPSSAAYGTHFTVAASGGASGNSLVFTSSGSCSNSGATYTMTSGAGTCSVIANQAGNANYSAAAQVTQTTNATQASQTITFTTSAPAGAAYGTNFTVVATGGASGNSLVFTSAGSCSNSGATYTMTSGAGTCSVIANQAGNANYAAAAQVTQTTNATLASQTITLQAATPLSSPALDLAATRAQPTP
ncbi:MAG: protease pro-enzyme activation domain-containing protein [Terriglobales bacterium]